MLKILLYMIARIL